MARFIKTDSGWVNLDHVRTISSETDKEGGTVLTFWDEKGRMRGSDLTCDEIDYEMELTGTVVPASPGETALILTVNTNADHTDGFYVETRTVPVVAWRVPSVQTEFYSASPPVPVLLDPAGGDNEHVMVRLPDGRIREIDRFDVTTYESQDAAEAAMLEQADWAHAQRKAKAEAA